MLSLTGHLSSCLYLGAEGTNIIFTFLKRFQIQLCGQEYLLESDWMQVSEPIRNWHPLHRLAICAVDAVKSCIANCTENRLQFIQYGGFTVLLNILEVFEFIEVSLII